jgi:hypothetical protein
MDARSTNEMRMDVGSPATALRKPAPSSSLLLISGVLDVSNTRVGEPTQSMPSMHTCALNEPENLLFHLRMYEPSSQSTMCETISLPSLVIFRLAPPLVHRLPIRSAVRSLHSHPSSSLTPTVPRMGPGGNLDECACAGAGSTRSKKGEPGSGIAC